MAYMIDKFKGKYRLKAPYDHTFQFPRDLKGNYSDIDIYIDCNNGVQVSYFGHSKLLVYIPSLGRGRNMVKNIYSEFVADVNTSKYITVTEREKDGETITTNSFDYDSLYKDADLNKIIFDIEETDEEVLFKFKADDMLKLEKYLKPKTSGASRSPFSSKNLPKSDYEIPEEDMNKYKEIVAKLPKEDVLKVGHWTNDYLKTLATKKNKLEDIKADMKLKCMKAKEYINFIDKWDDYLNYLESEIQKLC